MRRVEPEHQRCPPVIIPERCSKHDIVLVLEEIECASCRGEGEREAPFWDDFDCSDGFVICRACGGTGTDSTPECWKCELEAQERE